MKTFRVLTLGCKVNQYESEALRQQFLAKGYRPAKEGETASVSIVNTCSVTNTSDRKSRQLIRKCTKNSKIVAVCGCYAQAKPEEAAQIDGVDLVVGTGNKQKLFSMIDDLLAKKQREKISIFPLTAASSFDTDPITSYQEKTRAIIKIQDGCNSFCSYCIIPYVRGRLRSRPPLEILQEVTALSQNGYREIVLAGIHVCHYGLDFPKSFPIHTLVDLLKEIEKIPKIDRIRLSSIEPLAFTNAFFAYYKTTQKLCPHFHISLQSGSDTVLKRMNRHYCAESYKKTVKKLQQINPLTTVTTDIITGFPGESSDEFEETLALIKSIRFLKVHTFPYSRRSGTAADTMPNQLPFSLKEERAKKVIALSRAIEKEILAEFIGTPLTVLAEEAKNNGFYGLSQNYLPVILEDPCEKNALYHVIPYRSDGNFLYAKHPQKQ